MLINCLEIYINRQPMNKTSFENNIYPFIKVLTSSPPLPLPVKSGLSEKINHIFWIDLVE